MLTILNMLFGYDYMNSDQDKNEKWPHFCGHF